MVLLFFLLVHVLPSRSRTLSGDSGARVRQLRRAASQHAMIDSI